MQNLRRGLQKDAKVAAIVIIDATHTKQFYIVGKATGIVKAVILYEIKRLQIFEVCNL